MTLQAARSIDLDGTCNLTDSCVDLLHLDGMQFAHFESVAATPSGRVVEEGTIDELEVWLRQRLLHFRSPKLCTLRHDKARIAEEVMRVCLPNATHLQVNPFPKSLRVQAMPEVH